MKGYQRPSWGGKIPTELFTLEVLKNGSVIDEIKLDQKDYYVIGRQPDVCDIGLDHPSISRIHAVLQFHENGELMIFDMNSAHGTFVNKKRINHEEYCRLNVGDFIKFGASTRSYILHGPESQRVEEYDSENMRAYRQKLAERSAEIKAKKDEEDSNGIGWGFREDAQNYDDDNMNNHLQDEEQELPDYIKNDPNYNRKFGEVFSSTIVDKEVSEKDQKLLEKLRKKEKKIQNMQQEISRIYMKENSQASGLTPGQIAAVERNDRHIEELREQVEAIERTLKEKMQQREGSKLGAAKSNELNNKNNSKKEEEKKKSTRDQDDDDDLLDTTQQTADISTNWRLKKKSKQPGHPNSIHSNDLLNLLSSHSKSSSSLSSSSSSSDPVSYEQLCQEKERSQQRYYTIMKEIQQHESVIKNSNEDNLESSGGDVDELERYLLKSQIEESQKKKQELFQEAQHLMSKIIKLERFIKISAPALSSLSTISDTKIGDLKATTTDSHVNSTAVPSTAAQKKEEEGKSQEINTSSSPQSLEGSNQPNESRDPQQQQQSISQEPIKSSSLKRNLRHSSAMAITNSSIPWEKTSESLEEQGQGQGRDQEDLVNVEHKSKKIKHHPFDSNTSTPPLSHPNEIKSQIKEKKSIGPMMPTQSRPSQSSFSFDDQLEGGETIWIPPKNQSGDGKTNLNVKYGY